MPCTFGWCDTKQNICATETSVGGAGIFFLVCYCLHYLSIDTYIVPHEALGAEITPNNEERTSVYTYVFMASIVGILLGAVFPGVIGVDVKEQNALIVPALVCSRLQPSAALPFAWVRPRQHSRHGESLCTFSEPPKPCAVAGRPCC